MIGQLRQTAVDFRPHHINTHSTLYAFFIALCNRERACYGKHKISPKAFLFKPLLREKRGLVFFSKRKKWNKSGFALKRHNICSHLDLLWLIEEPIYDWFSSKIKKDWVGITTCAFNEWMMEEKLSSSNYFLLCFCS